MGEHLAAPQTGQPGVSLGGIPFWVHLSLQFWVGVFISCCAFWSFCIRFSASPSLFLSQPLSLRLYEFACLTVSFSVPMSSLSSFRLCVSVSRLSVIVFPLYPCLCLMDGARGGEKGRNPIPRPVLEDSLITGRSTCSS